MNINDVEAPEEIPSDIRAAIFARQMELMEKYHEIERRNGLLLYEGFPVDLHNRFAQARLKDFAWRMTEEFTEATEAFDHGDDHYFEELIDGLHFLVELMILAGFYPSKPIELQYGEIGTTPFIPYNVIECVGRAMNCLKNKPWKQTHMLTDTDRFHGFLEEAWVAFLGLMRSEGILPSEIYQLYFRKAQVNSFRQRSNY